MDRLVLLPSGVGVLVGETWTWQTIDSAKWDDTVKHGYTALREPIRDVLTRAGALGRKLKVRYAGHEAAVEMLSLPLGLTDARQAAGLRIRESLGAGGVRAYVTLARVASPSRSATGTVLLIAADRATTIESIAEIVNSAGGVAEAVLPVRACVMRSAVATIVSGKPARASAVLWVDRHSSALAGGTDGACHFARSLSTGYDVFEEAIFRAARDQGGCDHQRAAALVFEIGIPHRDQVVDGPGSLRGDRVLPLLQPAIQRLAVEVKQTLRFGLPEGEANRVRLLLAGPGAKIPGLAAALANLVETEVAEIDADHDRARERAELTMQLSITPPVVERRRARRALIAAACFGAVAAIGAISADIAWSRKALNDSLQQAARNEHTLEVAKANGAVRDKITSLTAALGRLDSAPASTVGDPPSWSAGLAMLTRIDIPGLEIHEITAGAGNEGPSMVIRGLLPATSAGPGAVTLLVERLSESPVFVRVRAGTTRLVEADSGRSVYFSITAQMGGISPDAHRRLGMAVTSGGAQ